MLLNSRNVQWHTYNLSSDKARFQLHVSGFKHEYFYQSTFLFHFKANYNETAHNHLKIKKKEISIHGIAELLTPY